MKRNVRSASSRLGEEATLLPSAMRLLRSVNREFSTMCKLLAITSFLNLPCPVPSTSSVCSVVIFQRSRSSSRTFKTVRSSVTKPVRKYRKAPTRQRFQHGGLGILPRSLRKSGPGETLPWRSSLKIAFLRTAFHIAAKAAHPGCFATSFFLLTNPLLAKSSARSLTQPRRSIRFICEEPLTMTLTRRHYFCSHVSLYVLSLVVT